MTEERLLRPKLGHVSKRRRPPRLFISQVLAAAQRAGHVDRGWPARSAARHTAASRGRGGWAAFRTAERRLFGNRGRRVIVKARIVRQGFRGTGSLKAHLTYLQREGVTRDGAPARMFDRAGEDADLRGFAERTKGDRHHFRFVVSPEDATEMEDLRAFTRDLVRQMEQDLGTRLDWVALDHWNTGNPHVHLIVRGADHGGDALVIHRDYISRGMRERAAELVTIELGPQTEREIRARLAGEVGADRWTRLDDTLKREAEQTGGVLDFRPIAGNHDADPQLRALLVGRLQKLERMGLARSAGPARWRLAESAEPTLRDLGIRGDVIRTMQRAFASKGRERDLASLTIHEVQATPERPIVGRVVEKGLDDELKGSAYLAIDAVDGRVHYIRVSHFETIDDVTTGAIVAVGRATARPSDRAIAELAAELSGTYDPERHRRALARSGAADPDALVEAHVRRLEALRRGGKVVERLPDGRWQVPDDYLDRARAYDQRRGARSELEVRTLSRLPLDRQIHANGATWLDRELVAQERTALAATGFGREVQSALDRRADHLIGESLARRRGGQIVFARDLLDTLTRREMAEAAMRIARETGLDHRLLQNGDRVSGIYRRPIDLASGRFALIEDGKQFSLVPWRPVVERELGREVSGLVRAGGVSWTLGRDRGISI